jgi:hypothetical protein
MRTLELTSATGASTRFLGIWPSICMQMVVSLCGFIILRNGVHPKSMHARILGIIPYSGHRASRVTAVCSRCYRHSFKLFVGRLTQNYHGGSIWILIDCWENSSEPRRSPGSRLGLRAERNVAARMPRNLIGTPSSTTSWMTGLLYTTTKAKFVNCSRTCNRAEVPKAI